MHFFKVVLISSLFLFGCQTAIEKAARNTKYSAWEIVGVEKRDLFKKYLEQTKDGQEETKESLQSALDKLKEVYNFDGGNLESKYKDLNSSYEDAQSRANEVHDSIKRVNITAADLFEEWDKEIKEITSADLRAKSSASLSATKKKYALLKTNLGRSEIKIKPVLAKLKDQVLFLKHNLNAKAIASLKKEHVRIEKDIENLMVDIKASISAANEVIADMEKE